MENHFRIKKVVLALILRVAKALGLFVLARELTKGDLRILCYHGAALHDEDRFSPGLFIKRSTFASRMQHLADRGYPVISLDDALDRLKRKALPRCATVVTIDDGWYSTYRIIAPILQHHGFPATLYVASYYLEKQTQVFNVVIAYVLWKAAGRVLDLSKVANDLDGIYDLQSPEQREKAHHALNAFGESVDGADERQSLFRKLCETLDVDWHRIEDERLISFLNEEEARELGKLQIDIQLHTHRHHHFSAASFDEIKPEIDDNRAVLARVATRPLNHLCYPDGQYNIATLPWLEHLCIVSAVTTKPGFNRGHANFYLLRRFLDSEHNSQLEFEAEMSGFFELIRRCGYSI